MPAKLALAVFAAGACFGQTTLRQYLNLTDTQAVSILRLNQDYQAYRTPQESRAFTLNNQLYTMLNQPAPDPLELGNTAAALESIRRDEASKQTALRSSAAALLTAPQTAAVQDLADTATLVQLAQDAQCAYLVQAPSSQWFDTAAYIPVSAVPVTTPVNVPPAPMASFCSSTTFPISVRIYLSLTDSQVASIIQASAAYNDFYTRQQNRLADLTRQIQEVLAAGNPDPVIVGLAYIEVANIGQQIRDKGAQLRDAAQSQLTPAQQARRKTLQDAENLSGWGVLSNAIGCNLLTAPPGVPDTGSGGYCTLY